MPRYRRTVPPILLAATLLAATVTGVPMPAAAAPPDAPVTTDGLTAGNGALSSVDLAGKWRFTPAGRTPTTITVPGGGWYKQGFTDVNQAVYERSITVPNTGRAQTVKLEFGAVNHEATVRIDGRLVGTRTTSFTPSSFDISPFVTAGSSHTVTVEVKGREALKNSANGRYLVPDAADWSEAVPQGIYRSAFLRVYPQVFVSDAHLRTSVKDRTLSYDVFVTNTGSAAQSVTLTGALSSASNGSFTYPSVPPKTVTAAPKTVTKVTVGPLGWNLGTASYWWPNVPYRAGYRAQLHNLAVKINGASSGVADAKYRFGFRESKQDGDHYYLNGARINYRGDSLQGANYDRIDNGGKGDAFDTLPGFLPPRDGNGGWPQAVDNYQRLNYNVVRIHQEPGSPYMLDVADELGLMIIDETAIRGSKNRQDFVAGRANMVAHARDLALRDRNHPSIIRWSQANETDRGDTNDSEQFQRELYQAITAVDGTRPISADTVKASTTYPGLAYDNFATFPHYLDGFGKYGTALTAYPNRPDGEGEYIWPKPATKFGFTWFATSTIGKRAKDAADLRPYALLSAWASVIPGVKTTDFITEEKARPLYGVDNLPNPWANSQIKLVQTAFHPVAAIDLPYWAASGASNSNGTFPLPTGVRYGFGSRVDRTITTFNDTVQGGTAVTVSWSARRDSPTGPEIASGSTTRDIAYGTRATTPVSFTAPTSGSRVYLQLRTAKGGQTLFDDTTQYFELANESSFDDGALAYQGSWNQSDGEGGAVYGGTNTFSNTTGDTATIRFSGRRATVRAITAPNHGQMAVSVDGGPEVIVDTYSASRTGDVAVWQSPVVAAGQHTLRIRVTGQRNAEAENNLVGVDRVTTANS